MALTDLQVTKQLNMFNALDSDGDGQIEHEDILAIVGRIAGETGLGEESAEYGQIKARWEALWADLTSLGDSDRDDAVSRDEWLAMHESLTDERKAGVAAFYWTLLDDDADGRISVDELRKLYRILGIEEDFATEAFPRFDHDGDGYVSDSEFAGLVEEYHGDDPDAAGNWLFGKV